MRCAPKQIVTDLAKHLKALGYNVGRVSKLIPRNAGGEGYAFNVEAPGYEAFKGPGVKVKFFSKECDVAIAPLASEHFPVEYQADVELTREINDVIRRIHA